MGGLMILLGLCVATVLWANPLQSLCVDRAGRHALLRAHRLLRRLSEGDQAHRIGLLRPVAGFFSNFSSPASPPTPSSAAGSKPFATSLTVPFFKDVVIDLGPVLFVCLGIFVIVGAGNAVNLTDGLDGLAIVPVMIAASAFGIIAYLVGNKIFADYLQIHFVPGAGELAVICGALLGAGLGFLWFNAPPAMIFMGDTGSLALGGALGSIAVAVKHEIVLAIVGGLFVLETVSVIVQVLSFKLTGKRVFRMAPLHHHFEQKGWAEPTVVVRFWIIAVILALIGLTTLKLR